MSDLHTLVLRHLALNGISAREVERRAAAKNDGEIVASNTTISSFLGGGRVTPKIRRAFHLALGWSEDWPENPPPLPVPAEHDEKLDQILNKLNGLATKEHLDEAIAKVVAAVLGAGAPTGGRATRGATQPPPGSKRPGRAKP